MELLQCCWGSRILPSDRTSAVLLEVSNRNFTTSSAHLYCLSRQGIVLEIPSLKARQGVVGGIYGWYYLRKRHSCGLACQEELFTFTWWSGGRFESVTDISLRMFQNLRSHCHAVQKFLTWMKTRAILQTITKILVVGGK